MKKWVLILLILFSSLTVFSQRQMFFGLNRPYETTPVPVNYPFFGMGGYSINLTNGQAQNYVDANATSTLELIFKWNEIETSNGVYDFSEITSALTIANNKGFQYVMLQINLGTDAPFSILTPLGVQTFTTNSANVPGPYPDYYSATYNNKVDDLYEAFIAYMEASAFKSIIYAVKIVWASTGDFGPYKGGCTTNCLGISDNDTWVTYVQNFYTRMHNLFEASTLSNVRLAVNASNDARILSWVSGTYPDDVVKKGDLGHDYVFDFEILHPKAGYISQSEIQDYAINSTHAYQEVMCLMGESLSCGLKTPNITSGWFANPNSQYAIDFFNEMVTQQYAPTSTKGFIYLAQKISYDSTGIDWLPTATYGNVIGNVPAYNNRITQINNNTFDGEAYKQVQRLAAQRTFINNTRVSNIQAAFPQASFVSNDPYNNDGGYGLKTNYSLNVTQNNVHTTSKGLYRITQTPDTSLWGRYAAEFIISGGSGEMQFDITDGWAANASSGNITFDIVYYNSGTGTWALQANTGSGMANVATQTNTNTNKWLHKVVTVNNMQLGSSTDFKLKYISGNNTTFCFIKFTKN